MIGTKIFNVSRPTKETKRASQVPAPPVPPFTAPTIQNLNMTSEKENDDDLETSNVCLSM